MAGAYSAPSFDAAQTDQNETCEQANAATIALCNSFTLDILDSSGLDQDIFARLKINVQQGSVIHNASLKLQVAASFNSLPEFQGGTGSITLQVQVQDTDDAAAMIHNTENLRLRSFTHAESRSFSVPLHLSDEVSLDITKLIQAMVDRPGWVGGSYILLNLRRTAGTASAEKFGFNSARANTVRQWFSSPRVIIDTGCKVVNVSAGDVSSNETYEACESLTLDSSFTVSNDAEVFVSSGLDISFMPGFTINQGATLDAAVCGQSLCSASPNQPMPNGCHTCVVQICAEMPSCCDTQWSDACVNKVASSCSLMCQ